MRNTNVMKKALLAVSVAAAFGAASQAHAVVGVPFDQTGSSAAGVIVNQLVWNVDNALLYRGAVAGTSGAVLLAVGKLDNASGFGGTVNPTAGNAFTYELSIPVTVADNGSNTLTLTLDATRPALDFFNIYHTTGVVNQAAGTGYGAASGGTGTVIVGGVPDFLSSVMTLTYGLDTNGNLEYLKTGDALGQAMATDQFSGSRTVRIEVNSQDSAFFRGNLDTISFDLNLLTQAFGAPYAEAPNDPAVSALVQGITPDVGAATATTIHADDGTILATGAFPINDNSCNGGNGHGTAIAPACDIRLATGQGNLQILATTTLVPEPGTLALLGLGMGALGWTGIRRRRQKS